MLTRRSSNFRVAINRGLLLAFLGLSAISSVQGAVFNAPPGQYRTSWVGNTFGGNGGPNGQGYWVQNGADEIEVTPDGTVVAGIEWDEAGRCIGLYKDGKVNRELLKAKDGESAWGWGTANSAVAVNGEFIYAVNTAKKLLRFRWTPGNLESAAFVDETALPDKAVGLNSRGGRLAIAYANAIELRRTDDLGVVSRFDLQDVRDLVIAPDDSLWIIAGKAIRHLGQDGKETGSGIAELGSPTAVAFDNGGRLIVCDDGPDQQVKFYDVSANPKRVASFGQRGGLRSGTPGVVEPQKLFALRGAGTDKDGNLYVSMGFGGAPVGNLVLRSFTPQGQLRWELMNLAFVDTFGFDPDSDGSIVYSRTAVFDLDLSKSRPGSEWRLKAITLDHVNNPGDPRIKHGQTADLRRLDGRRLLYMIGQYAGGYRIYTFDEPHGQIAREVARIGPRKDEGEQWAWHVDSRGDIWHGDAPGKQIRRYAFGGWSADGKPKYDWEKPQTWPWPDDFQLVRRVIYLPESDTLYLFGYLKDQTIDSWGVVGFSGRRYDGWLSGKKQVRWTNSALPDNPKGSDQGTPLSPCSVAAAGDYLFVGMVKPENGRQYVHILRLADGVYVGSLYPGEEVGGNAGWEDMPYAVQALQRKNGEYLILVEEDWRGKNLLYRWTPEAGGAFGRGISSASPAKPLLPVKSSEDRRHLVDQQNRPLLYSADTAWLLFYRLSEQEAVEYMTRRQAQGFNAIQVMLAAEPDTTNIAGQKPFIDEDFARPNEAFFAHVDRVVQRAEDLGLILTIAPIWAGTGSTGWAGKKDGHLLPMKVNGPEKCRSLGRYLGGRYGKHRNLLWIMGGDDDPHEEREEYRQLALGLKDKAPYQLVTYHAASTHSSSDVWPAEERWLDMVMTYTYFRGFNKAWTRNQPDVYEANYKEYAKKPVRPFFLGESTYEGEHGAWGSALQARKNAYWSVLSGATGHAYGSPNWHLPADWRRIIDLPGANSLRHFYSLFTSRPWHRLVPDEKNQVATAGQGQFASNDYATTAIASDGTFCMTYMPSRRKITIDLSRLSGKQIQAWWFNPRTGQAANAGVFPATGSRQFEPAEEGDWVLVLDDAAEGYAPPGVNAGR